MILFFVLSLLCEAGLLYFLIIKWFKYEQELVDESKVRTKKKTTTHTTNKKAKSENNKSGTSKKNVSKKQKNTKRAASSA